VSGEQITLSEARLRELIEAVEEFRQRRPETPREYVERRLDLALEDVKHEIAGGGR
jgi:hypothetical protein